MKLTISFIIVLTLISCDAHMQKGLELYHERYISSGYVSDLKQNDKAFWTEADNPDTAFLPTSETTAPALTQPKKETVQTSSVIQEKKEGALFVVKNITLKPMSDRVEISFWTNSYLGEHEISADKANSLVLLDIPNAKSQMQASEVAGDGDYVNQIKVEENGQNLRVIFGLVGKMNLKYRIDNYPQGFKIVFSSN